MEGPSALPRATASDPEALAFASPANVLPWALRFLYAGSVMFCPYFFLSSLLSLHTSDGSFLAIQFVKYGFLKYLAWYLKSEYKCHPDIFLPQ